MNKTIILLFVGVLLSGCSHVSYQLRTIEDYANTAVRSFDNHAFQRYTQEMDEHARDLFRK